MWLSPSSGRVTSTAVPSFLGLRAEIATESFDAVTQADESGTVRRIGAADAVVADRDVQDSAGSRYVDAHG